MPAGMGMVADSARLILYHKQDTSARTRFLCHAGGHVCAFAPLPPQAEPMAERGAAIVAPHPAALLNEAGRAYGLSTAKLEFEPGFHETLQTPDGTITIYLVRITTIDPPSDAVAERGGRFIAITEARGVVPAELELLRRAYQVIMGG